MNINKKEKNNTNTTPTDILQNIKTTLQQTKTKTKTFTQQIQLYGIINYTRTQYLPQLSQKITENPQHKNKFYNYTTLESMINDLLEIIELNTINQLENTNTKQENTNTKQEKTQKIIQQTTTLLQLLQQTLTTQEQKQEQITQQIQQTQTQYYQLIYNEHSNKRIQ